MSFYKFSENQLPECPPYALLNLGFRRAGVLFYCDLQDRKCVVESKFIPRFRASGNSEDDALKAFGKIIQESNNWCEIGAEFCGKNSNYSHYLSQEVASEFDETEEFKICSPIQYWNGVILRLLEDAYESEPRDLAMIEKIYAFSEWCYFQESNVGIQMCAVGCFLEHVMYFDKARADMPNWFNRAELEWIILDSKERLRADIDQAYARSAVTNDSK